MAKKIQPAIHPREPIAAGLTRIVGELVNGALATIEHPSAEPDEDIHKVRVSMKRLRALLLLIRPVVTEKSYERDAARLRDAARRLAFSRDISVARKTLREFAKIAAARRDRDAFAQALKGFRQAVEPPDDADHRKAFRAVAATLRQSRKSLPRLSSREQGWQTIGPGLEEVYRGGRKRMKRAFTQDDEAAFHRWRIRVKNLFYELQILAPIWPARLRKTLACLETLQEKLGADHDLAVVKSALQEAPDAFGGAGAIQRVIVCLDRRSRKLRKASRQLGETIFSQKPRRFIYELKQHWNKWRVAKGSVARKHAPRRQRNRRFKRNPAAAVGRQGSPRPS